MCIHLEKLLPTFHSVSFGSEVLYNLSDAFERFKEIGENRIKICPAVITPFYVDSGRRLELYAFELTLAVVPQYSPIEVYLMKRTGTSDLSKIDPHIISRLKHCYLEALATDQCLTGNTLAQYCSFLFASSEIQNDVKQIPSSFQPSHLYFSYY